MYNYPRIICRIFFALVILAVAACGGSTAESSSDNPLAGRASQDAAVFYKTIGEPEQLDPGFVMESEGGEGFPTLKISYNTLESHKAVAEFVQQEWSKNLGINAELENMEWKVFLEANRQGDFQIARRGWIPGILDPKELLTIWKGDEPVNVSGWVNPRFDALLEESDQTVDQATRLELLAEAERVWLEDAPGITLYYYRQHNMVQPWVEGFSENVLAAYPTTAFSITTGQSLARQ